MQTTPAENRKAKLERAPWLDRGYGLFKDPSRPVPVIAFPDGSSHELGERRSRGSRSVSAANCKVAMIPVVTCPTRGTVEEIMDGGDGGTLEYLVPSVHDSLNVRQRESRGYDPTEGRIKKAA